MPDLCMSWRHLRLHIINAFACVLPPSTTEICPNSGYAQARTFHRDKPDLQSPDQAPSHESSCAERHAPAQAISIVADAEAQGCQMRRRSLCCLRRTVRVRATEMIAKERAHRGSTKCASDAIDEHARSEMDITGPKSEQKRRSFCSNFRPQVFSAREQSPGTFADGEHSGPLSAAVGPIFTTAEPAVAAPAGSVRSGRRSWSAASAPAATAVLRRSGPRTTQPRDHAAR